MKRKLFSTLLHTAQEMKFSIKDFSSKCDQIHRKLQFWSDLLEKCLMENFILVQWCKHFQGYLGILMYIPPYLHTRRHATKEEEGIGQGFSAHFLEETALIVSLFGLNFPFKM